MKAKPKKSRASKKPKKTAAKRTAPSTRVKRKTSAAKVRRKPIVKKAKRKPIAAKAKRKPVAVKAKRKPVAAKATRKKTAKPAKKPAPKPKKTASRKPATATRAPERRDGTGHLAAKYAADLRARSRDSAEPKDADSFVHGSSSTDPLAEELGEEFVNTALTGEDTVEESLEREVPEERGGPFVESTAGQEFADGTDASNPDGAKREPFPRT